LNWKGGLVYAGSGGRGRGEMASGNKDFQPRFGFAYQFDPKTVFRGSYGISFVPSTQAGYDGSAIGFSSVTAMVTSNDGGRTPANTLSNPFPTGLLAPTGNSLRALTRGRSYATRRPFDGHRRNSLQCQF